MSNESAVEVADQMSVDAPTGSGSTSEHSGAPRFFIGSSTGVITMVPEFAEPTRATNY